MKKNVVVVGTSFMAIYGKSSGKLVEKESNIGAVEFSLSGTGRNLAEDLSLLGMEVSLITAIADDSFGSVVIDNAHEQGIMLLEEPMFGKDLKTGIRVAFADCTGQTYAGINDMEICSRITPSLVERNINALYSADCIALESGISQETIEYICDLGMKVYACCSSASTCKRLSNVLDKLFMFSANLIDARIFTEKNDVEDCVRELVARGLSRGAIALGMDGALCFEKKLDGIHIYKISNLPDKAIVDLSGCTSSFLAGFVIGLTSGKSMPESLIIAQSASCVTSCQLSPVSRELSPTLLDVTIGRFKETTSIQETVI